MSLKTLIFVVMERAQVPTMFKWKALLWSILQVMGED
jgi:hypothetical protein